LSFTRPNGRFGAANDIDSDFLKVFILGMSRRRRGKEPDLMDLVPPVLGFLLLVSIFVPGFLPLVGGIVFLAVLGGGIALIGLIAWGLHRHFRRLDKIVASAVQYAGSSLLPPIIQSPAPRAGYLPTFAVHGNVLAESRVQFFWRELLDSLEWRRFEELVTWYFHKAGFRAERSRVGADGGVDIHLFRTNDKRPFAYVQCKAWHTYDVGVKPVRELFGVMAADGIGTGYFVTSGDFTADALEFAKGQPLKLVTGDHLLEKLNSLPEGDRSELLYDVTQGDYTTPTCPRCDLKMVLRHGPTGEFWGCPNFRLRWPQRCKQTFKRRDAEAA
jgi:hypothetical protein